MSTLSSEAVLAKVRDLPALSQAVMELAAAIRRDDMPLERIVSIIARDQALAARALRWANSPFYGVSGRVSTVREAIGILGLQTIGTMATTSAVMASIGGTGSRAFNFSQAWRHAISTAVCSRAIAKAVDLDEDVAFTAGLLHDVGRLALAVHFPGEMAAACSHAAAHDVALLDAEHTVLATDHAAVGGIVAMHWRFSPSVAHAIAWHHDVPNHGGVTPTDVVHVADNICHALDLMQASDDRVPELSLVAWERVGLQAKALFDIFAQTELDTKKLCAALDV